LIHHQNYRIFEHLPKRWNLSFWGSLWSVWDRSLDHLKSTSLTILDLSAPKENAVLWTPQLSHGCSGSCLHIGPARHYDRILLCRFEYKMRGGRRSDICRIGEGGVRTKTRAIGNNGRTCSLKICQRSIINTQWLRRTS
jgi:hypothetical protein